MVSQLPVKNWQVAIVLLILAGAVGLVMAVADAGELLGAHGVIVMAFAAALLALLLRHLDYPERPAAWLASHCDDPIRPRSRWASCLPRSGARSACRSVGPASGACGSRTPPP